MSHSSILRFLLALSAFASCAAAQAFAKPRLVNQDDLPAKYHDAATAVVAVLVAEKEEASEFFAKIEEREEGKLFLFHLLHESLFGPPNRGPNPGGKSRDIVYDTRTGKASPSVIWPTKKKPNQSSEPTPTSGTSAAEQPRVPAAVVAHL